jgi:CBS domain-containing protein
LVVDEGRLKGILVLRNIKAVPRPNWGVIRVKDIMVPVDKLIIARPDQDVLSIMEQVAEHGIEQIPVISEGRVIGLIDCDNLMKFLRIRSELGIRMIY